MVGGIAIDITDRLRAEEALREADQRKDEFLAMLAHELRNPLAATRNAVEVLGLPDVGADQAGRARAVIGRQVRHLVRMVDDLLDVSRLLRGKVAVRPEPVDLADVLTAAAELARPHLDARGHALAMTLPDRPVGVTGDRVRLTQVVANLLDNAAKFTDRPGRITLAGGVEEDRAVIRVRDPGVGIPPGLLPTVFDLFVQGDQSAARTRGGLGIGLTLVKRLVELHGGTVEANSEGLGRGSEFVVRLPIADGGSRVADSEAGNPPSAIRNPQSRRVLVVDDNVDAAEGLATLLRAAGHTVATAHSGPAALEAVPAFRPDAVVLDIGLPGMDGYNVARRLRQLPGPAAGALLVALTGYGQDEYRRRSRAAGFDRHLIKPVDLTELLGLIAAVTPRS
jgi:CheY-like chemotaxis protein/nitrogen-specific signal transduction histidine kinase